MAKEFVPATDEVWRLQQGNDPECVFFQAMADEGHYGGRPGASRQGTYICAPSGKLLASVNSNRPERVLATMQQGLDQWKELPAGERLLAEDAQIKSKHRWEDYYPEDGLVLSMYTRDLPANGEPDQERASKWNQDQIWFSKSESRQWLPTELAENAEYELPLSLATRLVGLHLVDTVKGQTAAFSPSEVKTARITVKVVELTDTHAEIEISGQTHADSTRQTRRTSPHGVKTKIRGHANYDLENKRFSQFELVAIGQRQGHTRHNGRRNDLQAGHIGFVIRLTGPNEPRIAPAFIYHYETDWVKQPNR